MKKKTILAKNEKNCPRKTCCDIVFICRDIISKELAETMSQQVALCRNKDQA